MAGGKQKKKTVLKTWNKKPSSSSFKVIPLNQEELKRWTPEGDSHMKRLEMPVAKFELNRWRKTKLALRGALFDALNILPAGAHATGPR